MHEKTQTQPTQQKERTGKSRRGFASMDKDRHKLVSSKGGKSERQYTPMGNQVRQISSYEGL